MPSASPLGARGPPVHFHPFIHSFITSWHGSFVYGTRFASAPLTGEHLVAFFFFWFCGVGSNVLTSSTSFFGLRKSKACVM